MGGVMMRNLLFLQVLPIKIKVYCGFLSPWILLDWTETYQKDGVSSLSPRVRLCHLEFTLCNQESVLCFFDVGSWFLHLNTKIRQYKCFTNIFFKSHIFLLLQIDRRNTHPLYHQNFFLGAICHANSWGIHSIFLKIQQKFFLS